MAEPIVSALSLLQDEARQERHQDYLRQIEAHEPCSWDPQPKRQQRSIFYFCKTCYEKCKMEAAICFPCILACHKEHDFVEVGQKRNVQCDCGTKRVPVECKKLATKPEMNENNQYNHNFVGRFCWCDEPEDCDHDDDRQDVMFQCFACQDWYHNSHIGKTPEHDSFVDYLCRDCAKINPQFWPYVDEGYATSMFNALSMTLEQRKERELDLKRAESAKQKKRKSTSDGGCVFDQLGGHDEAYSAGRWEDVFWHKGWRTKLCRCPECTEKLREKELEFLLTEEEEEDADDDESVYWTCDGCEKDVHTDDEPRWHCEQCEDFDLCDGCFEKKDHTAEHTFHKGCKSDLPCADHISSDELQVGTKIVAKDFQGKWYQAEIVQKSSSSVKVHFIGWQERYDEVIELPKGEDRLRKYSADAATGPYLNNGGGASSSSSGGDINNMVNNGESIIEEFKAMLEARSATFENESARAMFLRECGVMIAALQDQFMSWRDANVLVTKEMVYEFFGSLERKRRQQ